MRCVFICFADQIPMASHVMPELDDPLGKHGNNCVGVQVIKHYCGNVFHYFCNCYKAYNNIIGLHDRMGRKDIVHWQT